jgi:hypothetical protein
VTNCQLDSFDLSCFLLNDSTICFRHFAVECLEQWISNCGTRTPGGTRRTSWGYAKIILVIEENTKKKKGIKVKTEKQSYEVFVYEERLM